MMVKYDASKYRSPERLYDPVFDRHLDEWMTTQDYTVTLCDGRDLTIPAGFVYDKASVPRAAWWYLNRDDAHVIIAALVHDYLYEHQEVNGEPITRKEADQVFHQIIKQSGMRTTKAYMVYLAVRAGGWVYWNKRKEALNKGRINSDEG